MGQSWSTRAGKTNKQASGFQDEGVKTKYKSAQSTKVKSKRSKNAS